MGIAATLALLAVHSFVRGLASGAGRFSFRGIAKAVRNHFRDHAGRLDAALERSGRRAWKALEVALAGNTWWNRCRRLLASADDRRMREQIQAFLDSVSLPKSVGGDADFRRRCLEELRAARDAGVLAAGYGGSRELQGSVGGYSLYGHPRRFEAEQGRLAGLLAAELERGRHPNLARLLALGDGPPLVVVAAAHYFQCEVQEDAELFRGFAMHRLDELSRSQEAGLTSLHDVLARHGDRLDQLFSTVVEIYDEVMEVQRQIGLLRQELQPTYSFSVRGDAERRLVRAVLERYRELPEETRRGMPVLLGEVGKVKAAAGRFAEARDDFQAAAGALEDPADRARAHFEAYRAALEQREWEEALASLRQSMDLDAGLAPLPLDRFVPVRILGAGGFGVAFLCRHVVFGNEIVVKALTSEDLDRSVQEVFREAKVLYDLDHPGIIRIQDCGYVDAARGQRPYLQMDFFDGVSLNRHVKRHGRLTPEQLPALARPVADALRAAHAQGVLHRDVKPANVLVRPEGDRWRTMLIDFGLAMSASALQTGQASVASERTLAVASVAGTLGYAAPEQMGMIPGRSVAPTSDVFGFGRTCCFALFGTPTPLARHYRRIPPGLADLLDECTTERPEARLRDFDEVIERLDALDEVEAVSAPVEAAPPPPPPPPIPVEAREPVEEEPVEEEPLEDDSVEEELPALLREPGRESRPEPEPEPEVEVPVEVVPAPPPVEIEVPAPVEAEIETIVRPRERVRLIDRAGGRPPPSVPPPPLATGKRRIPRGMVMIRPKKGRPFTIHRHPPVFGTPAADELVASLPEGAAEDYASWVRRHGGPPDRDAARELLRRFGLRLPTLDQMRSALATKALRRVNAPVWLREEPHRLLLPDGTLRPPDLLRGSARRRRRRELVAVGEPPRGL
jgi:serine/threonine protein kinase